MRGLKKIMQLFELKHVDRAFSVRERAESSAEHSWGCLILADYFLERFNFGLNRQKVMDLLLYHDFIEIEAGDTYFLDEKALLEKKEKERRALAVLKEKIPLEITKKFVALFNEYEEKKTRESLFCHAIDCLEPTVYVLRDKPLWQERGLTEKILREKKEPHVAHFPELLAFFNELVEYAKKEGYFC